MVSFYVSIFLTLFVDSIFKLRTKPRFRHPVKKISLAKTTKPYSSETSENLVLNLVDIQTVIESHKTNLTIQIPFVTSVTL